MDVMTPEEINRILEVPEEDKFTPVKITEASFMYDWIKKNHLSKTLEVGFGYARSAAYIMNATGQLHIAMDPFQSHYNDLGLKNVERLGLTTQLDFRRDYSHNVLPQLLKDNRKFDFIFIDGDHKYDGIFIDFYYADLLLEKNGYVLFHDTWMRSTQLVTAFVSNDRKDYRRIKTPLRNLCLFQKTGDDKRNWMFFREFYNFRSIVIHPVIEWLNTGEQTGMKKFVLSVKEKLK
jgi:predicted O-methyltransferase YrrM